MSSRRRTGCVPLILAPIIVFGAVGAFLFYQSHSSPEPQTVAVAVSTAPASTLVIPTPTSLPPTPQPVTLKVAVEKAQIFTPIVELYFSPDSDGWNLSTLGQYAGHLQGTPNIGQGGNAVLAGHVELKDGSAGPFARLNALNPGDRILILSDDPKKPIVMQYLVTVVKTVDPNAIDEIRSHGHEELTLVTCEDWDPKVRSYQKRVVVHAQPLMLKQ